MFPVHGTWADLQTATNQLTGLDGPAQAWAEQIVERLRPCLVRSHPPTLSEDYIVYAITALDQPMTAETMLRSRRDHRGAVARRTAAAERAGARGGAASSHLDLVDDLVVPTWNAAFVYDTDAGLQAALEIFEFANSQLLEFRYYDDLLESELARIYDTLQEPRWYDALGPRYVRAARRLHALFVDVNELTDKTRTR